MPLEFLQGLRRQREPRVAGVSGGCSRCAPGLVDAYMLSKRPGGQEKSAAARHVMIGYAS